MLPANTSWPPYRLTPNRLDSESRPFLLLPPAFLCAIDLYLRVNRYYFLAAFFFAAFFFAVFFAAGFSEAAFFATFFAAFFLAGAFAAVSFGAASLSVASAFGAAAGTLFHRAKRFLPL